MVKLTDLGFSKGTIFETILSTYNIDGIPNAAPMGVTLLNEITLNLSIYNSSQTSRNLKTSKCGIVNLTSDIDVFYKTTFKEANPTGRLPQELFEKAEMMNAPRLRLAEATIEVSIVNMEPFGSDRTKFSCNVEKINAVKMHPQVICRAKGLTLEAIIHATRVKAYANDEKQQESVDKLLATMEDSNDIIKRIAQNSTYSAVMADLMQRIDSWRNKP
jgi:hypothetical protein